MFTIREAGNEKSSKIISEGKDATSCTLQSYELVQLFEMAIS